MKGYYDEDWKPTPLWILGVVWFGWTGIPRLIKRRYTTGVIYLLTFGLWGFGWLYDIIILIINTIEHQRNLKNRKHTYKKENPYVNTEISSNATHTYIQKEKQTSKEIEKAKEKIKQLNEEIKRQNTKNINNQETLNIEETKEVKQESNQEIKISNKTIKEVTFKVAGTSFRNENIEELGDENYYYGLTKKEIIGELMCDERIYEYDFPYFQVTFEDEPDNPYDPKAIKILFDDVHIGYVKKGSQSRIRNLLKKKEYYKLYGVIYGGKYKIVFSEDEGYEEYSYELVRDRVEYSAKVIFEFLE